jgi:hypothetical protein
MADEVIPITACRKHRSHGVSGVNGQDADIPNKAYDTHTTHLVAILQYRHTLRIPRVYDIEIGRYVLCSIWQNVDVAR